MYYTVKKNNVSLYPNPQVNCTVIIFAKAEDKEDESKAVYWIPFNINLTECIGMTKDQLDQKIQEVGTNLYEDPNMKPIYDAIMMGLEIA